VAELALSLLYMACMILLALFFEWLDRKIVARLQSRVGPLYTGPRGILQPLADLVKLLSKESIVPAEADTVLFTLAPCSLLVLQLLAGVFIPFAGGSLVTLDGDLILVLGLTTLYVVMTYMAGVATPSRYSMLGAERAALMMVSFDIPLTLSCLCMAMMKGSLELQALSNTGLRDWRELAVGLPAFIVFLIAAQAELERVPFDIPEADTEIVAGWQVEYSSWRLALIRLADDVQRVVLIGVGVALFLGGCDGPLPPPLEWLLRPLYFLAKSLVLLFLLSVFRASFARVRIDQVARFCWQVLIPLSLALLVASMLVV